MVRTPLDEETSWVLLVNIYTCLWTLEFRTGYRDFRSLSPFHRFVGVDIGQHIRGDGLVVSREWCGTFKNGMLERIIIVVHSEVVYLKIVCLGVVEWYARELYAREWYTPAEVVWLRYWGVVSSSGAFRISPLGSDILESGMMIYWGIIKQYTQEWYV